MYLMYADEADQDGGKEFLVYAGVFIPMQSVGVLHSRIESFRQKSGFADGDLLKFGAQTAPKKITKEAHTEIKNAVLSTAAECGCKTCCYIVPHAIAKGQDLENKLKFAVNTLLGKFDEFLRENNVDGGVACFDRTTDYKQIEYFKEVMELGLLYNGKRKKLSRVAAIHQSQIGLSHLASLTDIIVGSFRFAINEPNKDVVGAALMQMLTKTMWGIRDNNGVLHVSERGICIRPKTIQVAEHQADIHEFIKRLESYSNA